MGKLNTKQILSIPKSNLYYIGENDIPADIMEGKQKSFDFYSSVELTTLKGYRILRDGVNKSTKIPAGKVVTLISDPSVEPKAFRIKNSDDFFNFRKDYIFSQYNEHQVSAEQLNDPGHKYPYITRVDPVKAASMGLGAVYITLIYFPNWAASDPDLNHLNYGTQLAIKHIGTMAKTEANNTQAPNAHPSNWIMAMRFSHDRIWSRWRFSTFGMDAMHIQPPGGGTAENPFNINNCTQNMMTYYSTWKSENVINLPNGVMDGVILPLMYHDGQKDFSNQTSEEVDIHMNGAQLFASWHQDSIFFRTLSRTRNVESVDGRWSPWKKIHSDYGRLMVDRRASGDPQYSISIGTPNMGIHHDWDGQFSFRTNSNHICHINNHGLHMNDGRRWISVREIRGGVSGTSGDLLLNMVTGKKVIFKRSDGQNATLQDLFTFADNGKRIVVDAIIHNGTPASTTDSWEELGDKIRRLKEPILPPVIGPNN